MLRRCWPPFGQYAKRNVRGRRRGAVRQRWQPPLRPPQIRRMQLAVARALGKLKGWRPLRHLQLLQALLHPGEGDFEKHLRLRQGLQGLRCLPPSMQNHCQWPVPQQCFVLCTMSHLLAVLSIGLLRPKHTVNLSDIERGVLGDLVRIYEAVCRASTPDLLLISTWRPQRRDDSVAVPAGDRSCVSI